MRAHRLAPPLTPAVLLLGLVMLATSVAYAQGTPDGETPAAEDICTLWGFTGNDQRLVQRLLRGDGLRCRRAAGE